MTGAGGEVLCGSGKYCENILETLGFSIALIWSSSIFILSSLSLDCASSEVILVWAILISCCR